MSRKKTHEQYVAEVAAINPNIEVVGTYVNLKTKIVHKCLIDGYEWMPYPTNILQGCGCPMCEKINKSKTHEQYVEELLIKNPLIIVIGRYINSHTKITHKCVNDGNEWLLSPANALSGKGCPVCGGTMQKTHEQYVKELKSKNPSVVVVGQYVNNATKIMHKCLAHDYQWEVSPHTVLNGCGCPMCRSEKISDAFRKTHDEYVKEFAVVNKDVIVLEEYVNARTPIRHRCLVDGWEWDVVPDALLRGHGCPQCNKCSKSSGEKKVADWLDNHGILYKKQKTFDDCRDKSVLQFDFYLPDYNVCIEYNGKQHYEVVDYFGGEDGFKYTVRHDKIKEKYCIENNIQLFKIPYFEDVHEELGKIYELIKTQDIAKEVA